MSAGRNRSWSILTTILLFTDSLYVLMLLLTAACQALKHNMKINICVYGRALVIINCIFKEHEIISDYSTPNLT